MGIVKTRSRYMNIQSTVAIPYSQSEVKSNLMQKCIAAIDDYFWTPDDDSHDKVSFYKIALSVNAISILMLILILTIN